MTTDEKPEIISLCFGNIQIDIPESIEAINLARRLLDLLEEQLERQWQPIEHPPNKQDLASVSTQEDIEPPTFIVNGQIIHTAAHGIKELQIEAKPISAGEREDLDVKTSTLSENPPERILSDFFIPKFKWDKTKEKSYRTIFFFEHEDGSRVTIFYLNSRIFTTKEAIMTLPYPVPYNYAPLRAIQNNKRTALKFYREYLAKEAEPERFKQMLKDPLVQLALGDKALAAIKDRRIFEDIQLYNAENKDEDEIMSEAAREAEEKRMEKLRKAAEVNAGRWKESEMSPRTKELRKNIVLKASMGVGAD